MTDVEDDVAGSLIDALTGEGAHVDDGRFTLDPAAALAKLRQHQLADPHGYLLLLVEAAWIAGKTRRTSGIRIDTGADTTVEFPGPAFEATALRELFAAVLGGTHELDGDELELGRARVLQLLGLAANNALALEPEAITIEAGDLSGDAVRLRIDARGGLTLEPGDSLPRGQIRFRVHGSGLGLIRARAERALVEQRCAYSSLPVFVDGERVSNNQPGKLLTVDRVMLGGRQIGVAGYRQEAQLGKVWISNRGVGVAVPDADVRPGFIAVVEADLPMDLSRNQLLEGPELHAILAAIGAVRRSLKAPNYGVGASVHFSARSLAPHVGVLLACVAVAVVVGVVMTAWSVDDEPPKMLTRAEQIAICEGGDIRMCRALEDDAHREIERQEHARMACLAGDAPSCVRGALGASSGDEREGLLDRGCIGQQREACEQLIESTRQFADKSGNREPLRRALTRACLAVPGPHCVEAAWYYHYGFGYFHNQAVVSEGDEQPPDANELLRRGCEADVELACALQNRPTLAQGCEVGDALACYGLGIAETTPEAIAALERSCALGLEEGCRATASDAPHAPLAPRTAKAWTVP